MKIFISWSGDRSKAIASLLNDWIKCVIQASKPWISTRDIDRGALWFTEISDQLRETAVGVICLTQENKDRPWILFEAGALAKGLSSTRVCTFLIDLKATDLIDPLAQFNHTFPNKESVWGLVRTLNSSAGQHALEERVLLQVFDTYWPQFETGFAAALKQYPDQKKTEPRSDVDILDEILTNTRALNSRIRTLEAQNAQNLDTPANSAHTISEFIESGQADVYLRQLSATSLADTASEFRINTETEKDKIIRRQRILARAIQDYKPKQ